jgi:hypothetical protein
MNFFYYLLLFLKDDDISCLLEDKLVKDFHSSISTTNKSTTYSYLVRLYIFSIFLEKDFMA